ncbi:hypothetical protein EIN_093410 [Entamoeba invadens IP1]|uniref:Wntless-like transmembrane domain-containing protein n=1 Tax=Entamoeba invadens IP1 TaxID=370355 RepID=A0A0A1TZY1_ENTIV|nr:hypothetical protein EIN_093410 [Entamoeba invadens IP1]ELP87184.1 hypothetical protein EIN_093410 [Entamoeba invadens IP1]|eukprot:XP_004253955.1 hypothetical protein EIN_093410 [Entamoeba invadens IP1]
MGAFDDKQTLLSSLNRIGLVITAIVFAFLAIALTVISTAFTSTLTTTSTNYWQCLNQTSFNRSVCTQGVDPFPSGPEQAFIPSKVVIGRLARLNYKMFISLSASIPTPLTEAKHFTVPIHYALLGFETIGAANTTEIPELTSSVNVKFDCDKGACTTDLQLPQTIEYNFYTFTILPESFPKGLIIDPTLIVQTSNKIFTLCELFWRTSFIVIGSIQLCVFLICMRKERYQDWLFEQTCTGFLLYFLILFNNPMVYLEYQFRNWFFSLISSVMESFAIGYLLFYFLVVFDSLRKNMKAMNMKSLWLGFLVPRIVFCSIVAVAVGCFVFTQKVYDIKNLIAGTKNGVLITLGVLVILIVMTYTFWLFFSFIRTFTERKKLGEKGRRVIGFGIFTLIIVFVFTIVLTVLLFGGYDSSVFYLASIVYYNLYCFAMGFLMISYNKGVEQKKVKQFVIDNPSEIAMTVQDYGDDDEIIINEQVNEGVLNDEQISL